MSLFELEQIEEIKKLKARYFRLMDQRIWDPWIDLFTDDATLDCIVVGYQTFSWRGKAEILSSNQTLNADARSVHHGHTPDIILTSDTTATGSWALFDVYFRSSGRSEAYGYYEDEYVRTDGGWKIKSTKLTLEGAAS